MNLAVPRVSFQEPNTEDGDEDEDDDELKTEESLDSDSLASDLDSIVSKECKLLILWSILVRKMNNQKTREEIRADILNAQRRKKRESIEMLGPPREPKVKGNFWKFLMQFHEILFCNFKKKFQWIYSISNSNIL